MNLSRRLQRLRSYIFLLIFLVETTSVVRGYGTKTLQVQERYMNFEELYKKGKSAYLEDNFKECVEYLEAAISEYKNHNQIVNTCKLECRNKGKLSREPVVQHVEEYRHFEGLIVETLCLMNCKRGRVNPNRIEEIDDVQTLKDFESLKTYDYLQLCYYQTKRLQDAANAAYTNSLMNPEHEIMASNLAFYLEQDGVQPDKLVNLEAREFVRWYMEGKRAYVAEDWAGVVHNMENALKSYLQEEELCRAGCEKPFDMGWFPDFVSSVSNHFTFCLKCKLNCATQLHTINGKMEDDLLPLIFHYLQYAYFMSSDYSSALNSALTHLKLSPNSQDAEDMAGNVEYYRLAGGSDTDGGGTVRREALNYLERESDELALLEFIETSFVFPDSGTSTSVPAASDLQDEEEETNMKTTDQPMETSAQLEANIRRSMLENAKNSNLISKEDEQVAELLRKVQPKLISPPPVVKFEL